MQKNKQEYRRRQIYTKTLAHPKTLAPPKTLAHTKTLAHPKTKPKTKKKGIRQCRRSRKSRRRRWRINLLLGSAESAVADFSQAPLMVLFSSLLMCWIQVRRDLPVPCFYGRNLSCTVPAYCTGPPCSKWSNLWRMPNLWHQPKVHWF